MDGRRGMNRRILVVNGPNLNLLGTRAPEMYGSETLADAERIAAEAAREVGFDVRFVQSNSEGALVDAIHEARHDCDAVVITAGAYTHTPVAIRDALEAVSLPLSVVPIKQAHARAQCRHHSYQRVTAYFSLASSCGVPPR